MVLKSTKKQFQDWLKALRSGKYQQGKGSLNPAIGKFCCLGVACDITIPENLKRNEDGLIKGNKFLFGLFPSDQSDAPEWLMELPHDFLKRTGIPITVLNDDRHFSFEEIAEVLENVYVRGVLE